MLLNLYLGPTTAPYARQLHHFQSSWSCLPPESLPITMSVAVEAVWIGSAARIPLFRDLMPTSLVGGPQPLHARQGREMQRYNQEGARLVAGYDSVWSIPPLLEHLCHHWVIIIHQQCLNFQYRSRLVSEHASACCRCIPVKVSEVDGKVDVSVLMITSRGGKGLVFPKVRTEPQHLCSRLATGPLSLDCIIYRPLPSGGCQYLAASC